VLAELQSQGLVSITGEQCSFASDLQEAVRNRIPMQHRKAWIETVLRFLFAVAPEDGDEPRNWKTWEVLAPHAERILEFAEAEKIPYPTGLLMGDRLARRFLLLPGAGAESASLVPPRS
jgi:hypothetical protein